MRTVSGADSGSVLTEMEPMLVSNVITARRHGAPLKNLVRRL